MKRRLALLLCAVALVFGVGSQTLNRATPAYATSPACNPFDNFNNYYTDSYQSTVWLPYVFDSYWGINRAVRVDLRSWRFDGADGYCYRGYRVSAWTDDGHCCINMQIDTRTWICGQWGGEFITTVNRGTWGESWSSWPSGPQAFWLFIQVSPTEQAWVSFYNYTVGSGLGSYTCGPQADNWQTWADAQGTWSTDPGGVYAYGPPSGPSPWYLHVN